MTATGPVPQAGRDISEASRYLVLATADEAGRPWSSPVYFAHSGFAEFFWVSSPDVTHSRNIEVRPEVGIVIFDSHAAIGTGQAVSMSVIAALLEDDETARVSRRSRAARWLTAAAHGRARRPARGRAAALPRHCGLALDARQGRPARPSRSGAARLSVRCGDRRVTRPHIPPSGEVPDWS